MQSDANVIQMQPGPQTTAVSRKALWAGYVVSGLLIAFFLLDATLHVMKPPPVVDSFARLGYPLSLAGGLAVTEIVCIVLYAIPRTSILGAILLTGYLGGATASHVRIGDEFMMTVVFGVLVWLGLYWRDERLRALIPLRTSSRQADYV